MINLKNTRNLGVLSAILFLLSTSCVKIFNFDKGGGGGLPSFAPVTPNPVTPVTPVTPTNLTFSEFFQSYPTQNIGGVFIISTGMLVTSIKQNSSGNIYALAQLQLDTVNNAPTVPGQFIFNNETQTSSGRATSFLIEHDVTGKFLLQKWLNIPTTFLPVPYIKTPTLNMNSAGNLVLFGDVNDSVLPLANSTENFYLEALDANGNLGDLDASGKIVPPRLDTSSTLANWTTQARLIPSSTQGNYLTIISASNSKANLALPAYNPTFTLNQVSSTGTKSPSSVDLPKVPAGLPPLPQGGKWYAAMANQIDSKGNLYVAQPDTFSPSQIDIYKYNTTTMSLVSSQTFDMAGILPAGATFNSSNFTNLFQIYVDSYDNVYVYGTIPLGNSIPNIPQYPPGLPAFGSLGFVGKLNTSAPTLTVGFIYDPAKPPNSQTISVNDLATDSAGDVYVVGDFDVGNAPSILGASGLSGRQSSYIAKFSPSSIISATPTITYVKFLDGGSNVASFSSHSLLIHDVNKVYVAGSISVIGADGSSFNYNNIKYTIPTSPAFFLTAVDLSK